MELEKIMTNEIKDYLDAKFDASRIAQKEVLTLKEASCYAGLTVSYFYKLTSAHKVPHFKPAGKMIYVNRLELENWLQQNRVSTTYDLESKAHNYCLTQKGGQQ